jgi:hypothetical protein
MNTRDKAGLVHFILERPDDLKMGRTACFRYFSMPLYARFEHESRWDGTEDHVTCLRCIVCL